MRGSTPLLHQHIDAYLCISSAFDAGQVDAGQVDAARSSVGGDRSNHFLCLKWLLQVADSFRMHDSMAVSAGSAPCRTHNTHLVHEDVEVAHCGRIARRTSGKGVRLA
jgi:hypothetical protein